MCQNGSFFARPQRLSNPIIVGVLKVEVVVSEATEVLSVGGQILDIWRCWTTRLQKRPVYWSPSEMEIAPVKVAASSMKSGFLDWA